MRVSLRNQSFDKSRFQDLLAIRLAAGTSKMLHLQHCKFCVDRFFLFHSPLSRCLSFAPPHTGRTLAAVFNPCSLSANHSERRASIHPGINSRDSPPLPLLTRSLSLSLLFSLPGFFYPRGSTMACRSAGARRSFGINGRAWRAIFFLRFSLVSRIVLNARKIARHEIERIEELKISRITYR